MRMKIQQKFQNAAKEILSSIFIALNLYMKKVCMFGHFTLNAREEREMKIKMMKK